MVTSRGLRARNLELVLELRDRHTSTRPTADVVMSSFREQLHQFYSTRCPTKLGDVEAIASKYGALSAQRKEALFVHLGKKYPAVVSASGSSSSAAAASSTSAVATPAGSVVSSPSAGGSAALEGNDGVAGGRLRIKKEEGEAGDGEEGEVPPSGAVGGGVTAAGSGGAARATSNAVAEAATRAAENIVGAQDMPPHLNFRSAYFDPLLALQAKGLRPPNNAVMPLDNISKCRPLLPSTSEEHSYAHFGSSGRHHAEKGQQQKDGSGSAGVGSGKGQGPPGASSKAPRGRSDKAKPQDFISALAASLQNGPFSLLKECFEAKVKVSVQIRRLKGLRCVCTGYLKAFDKHMNMVLADVDEVTLVRDDGGVGQGGGGSSAGGAGSGERSMSGGRGSGVIGYGVRGKHGNDGGGGVGGGGGSGGGSRRLRKVRRHLRQILIRGDVVILVSRFSRKPT